MTQGLGRLRERWVAARQRRKAKRRERAQHRVAARADRERYDPHKFEGPGSPGAAG